MSSSDYITPSFFIIGERKCGTSSLYRYLVQHPNVLPCCLKEPNFFGKEEKHIAENIAQYWSFFPKKNATTDPSFIWPELNQKGILYEEEITIPRLANQTYITGEASANTFYEVAPAVVQKYLPNIKLILLLRNPIDRAFSHHRMYQRFQQEGRNLGFTVNSFEEDILAEMKLIQQGGRGNYLSPGIYLPSIKKWQTVFGQSAMKIYFTEDLNDPIKAKKILQELQLFLNLPHYKYGNYLDKKFNKAPLASFSPTLRSRIATFYTPYNQALFSYIGGNRHWS